MRIELTPSFAALPGQRVLVHVVADSLSDISSLKLFVDGVEAPLDADGRIFITPTTPGRIVLRAVATDADGAQGETLSEIKVRDTADKTAPVLALDALLGSSLLSSPLDIRALVQESNLDTWLLAIAPRGTTAFVELARGTAALDGVLTTLDPRLFDNGLYTLRLAARDMSGRTSVLTRDIEIDGQNKLGQYRRSDADLSVDLGGGALFTLLRQYDSLQAGTAGAFGWGWGLSGSDIRIETDVPLTGREHLGVHGAFEDGTRLWLTLPSGERAGFSFTPVVEQVGTLRFYRPAWIADAANGWTLASTDALLGRSGTHYFEAASGMPYNPLGGTFTGYDYTLTAPDGTRYLIDATQGIKEIHQTGGTRLFVSDNGITADSGATLQFVRDANNRISRVVAPDGSTLVYQYDAKGLLSAMRNLSTGEGYRYAYDVQGRLSAMVRVGEAGRAIDYAADGSVSDRVIVADLGGAGSFAGQSVSGSVGASGSDLYTFSVRASEIVAAAAGQLILRVTSSGATTPQIPGLTPLSVMSSGGTTTALFAIRAEGLYRLAISGSGDYTLQLGVAGDLNDDGQVDGLDSASIGDIDGDGDVDRSDRQVLYANYGFVVNAGPQLASTLPVVFTHEDLSVVVDLSKVATDPDGDAVYFRITGTENGDARISPDGRYLIFTPDAGYSGAASLRAAGRRRLQQLGRGGTAGDDQRRAAAVDRLRAAPPARRCRRQLPGGAGGRLRRPAGRDPAAGLPGPVGAGRAHRHAVAAGPADTQAERRHRDGGRARRRGRGHGGGRGHADRCGRHAELLLRHRRLSGHGDDPARRRHAPDHRQARHLEHHLHQQGQRRHAVLQRQCRHRHRRRRRPDHRPWRGQHHHHRHQPLRRGPGAAAGGRADVDHRHRGGGCVRRRGRQPRRHPHGHRRRAAAGQRHRDAELRCPRPRCRCPRRTRPTAPRPSSTSVPSTSTCRAASCRVRCRWRFRCRATSRPARRCTSSRRCACRSAPTARKATSGRWSIRPSSAPTALARTASPPFPGLSGRGSVLIARAAQPVGIVNIDAGFLLGISVAVGLTMGMAAASGSLLGAAVFTGIAAGIASLAMLAFVGQKLEIALWRQWGANKYGYNLEVEMPPGGASITISPSLPTPPVDPAELVLPRITDLEAPVVTPGQVKLRVEAENVVVPGSNFGIDDVRIGFRSAGQIVYAPPTSVSATANGATGGIFLVEVPDSVLLGLVDIVVERPTIDGGSGTKTWVRSAGTASVDNKTGYGFTGKGNEVYVIDTTRVDEPFAAAPPVDLSVPPANRTPYIDPATGQIVREPWVKTITIPGVNNIMDVLATNDLSRVFVAHSGGVSVIDAFTLQLIDVPDGGKVIPIPGGVTALAVDPAGRYLYAAGTGNIFVIDLLPGSAKFHQVSDQISVTAPNFGRINDLAVTADGKRLFAIAPYTSLFGAGQLGWVSGGRQQGYLHAVNVDEADKPAANAPNTKEWREELLDDKERIGLDPFRIVATTNADKLLVTSRMDLNSGLRTIEIKNNTPAGFDVDVKQLNLKLNAKEPSVTTLASGDWYYPSVTITGGNRIDLNIRNATGIAISSDLQWAFVGDWYVPRMYYHGGDYQTALMIEEKVSVGSKVGVIFNPFGLAGFNAPVGVDRGPAGGLDDADPDELPRGCRARRQRPQAVRGLPRRRQHRGLRRQQDDDAGLALGPQLRRCDQVEPDLARPPVGRLRRRRAGGRAARSEQAAQPLQQRRPARAGRPATHQPAAGGPADALPRADAAGCAGAHAAGPWRCRRHRCRRQCAAEVRVGDRCRPARRQPERPVEKPALRQRPGARCRPVAGRPLPRAP